jgi:RecB family endonuclease NucS
MGKFAYEKAISDYIANFPHHLEDGLIPYPDSKVREKVFIDRSRSDVLLIDRYDVPVIIECKQDSPTESDLIQLRSYMDNFQKETEIKPRGILVHGGSQKLNPRIHELIQKENDIEIMSYKVDIDFKRSS